MAEMRASVLKDSQFTVSSIPRPVPGPGEVLVKVRACGICGSDLHFFKHQRDTIEKARSFGADVTEMERAYSEGVVLGHEFVGEVVEFGPETQQALSIGDLVVSMPFVLKDGAPVLIGSDPETTGAYAEYMTLTEALLLRVDPDIEVEAAAFVEPLGIAVHAVNKAEITENAVAVIVGAGPIGLAIAAVLKARGIKHIIASDLSPKRRELVSIMGATHIIDGGKESVIAKAAEVAPGQPVFIFENTGVSGMINQLVLEAPQNAVITVTGIAAAEEAFLPMVAIVKELVFKFVIYYSQEEFAEALDMIRTGKLDWRELHTGTVGLNEIPVAFKDLADPETHAKIIIDPWADAPLQ
jgi:(R,R)-butanediol dehydrogenase/meso-butanediol dehydrogenase/diacetyl reductase